MLLLAPLINVFLKLASILERQTFRKPPRVSKHLFHLFGGGGGGAANSFGEIFLYDFFSHYC